MPIPMQHSQECKRIGSSHELKKVGMEKFLTEALEKVKELLPNPEVVLSKLQDEEKVMEVDSKRYLQRNLGR